MSLTTTVAGASTDSTPVVAYQGSPQHDGFESGAGVVPPLVARWHRSIGYASYPLIVDGIVYVAVEHSDGTSGTTLYAIDVKTGADVWGPIDLGGTSSWAGIAYDNGRVFALNNNGVLRAFDAASGTGVWATQLQGQFFFTSPPTAADGMVYTSGAGGGGTVYAIDESNGNLRWTASVENGDDSSPAVTAGAVYVSYACDQAYAFDPNSGALLWHHTSSCEGGGGETVAVHGGRVYTRDYFGNLILDGGTGAVLGAFSATTIPAFDGDLGFFLNGSTLSAEDGNGGVRWTFGGDGHLVTAPIVADGLVYVGSSAGNLYALDEQTGQATWSTNVGAPIGASDQYSASMLDGLAAGDGSLLVPVGSTLVAYSDAPTIAATATGTLGQAGWYTSPVTVHYTCGPGAGYAVATCPADRTIRADGRGQVITGTVTDTGGGQASTSITLNIDKTPPSGQVTSGDLAQQRVQGNSWDATSGVGSVTVTFQSALDGTTTATDPALSCTYRRISCNWSAAPPPGLLGSGSGPGPVWTGTVTVHTTDVAGNMSTSAPVSVVVAP